MSRMGVWVWAICASVLPAAFAEAQGSSTGAQLAQLETGVRAEEAVRAVKRVQNAYSHYIESGLWTDAADLLTDGASAQFAGTAVTGKDGIRGYLMQQAGRTSPGLARGQLNVHLILQPIVTLSDDGTQAWGTWHEIAMLGQFGSSASWQGGIYENEYRLDHGVWKIDRIGFFPQYSGAYDDFGHKAPPQWNVPYHFEATRVGVTIPRALLEAASGSSSGLAPDQHLSQLAQRVKRLNDETGIQNLQNIFAYYLDRKMWDDVADLFGDQGSLELAQRGVYVGREHIRHALEVMFGPSPLRTGELFDHINVATVVTLSADGLSAAARTSQLSMLGVNGEYACWEEGTYENEFVNRKGVWMLKAVHYYPRISTDYDLGWARDAKPAPGVIKEFPPDRPPTQRAYLNFPNIQYVRFHFTNPVTGRPGQYPSAPPLAVSDTTLSQVRRDLDRAIAVDAVENLNSSYGYFMDESAWDQMAETFAQDGSKEITGAGVYVGPERIRKVLNLRGPRGGRTPGFFTIHQLTQPVIDISADGNSAYARFRLVQGGGSADGSSASWIGGIYENTARKEHGEWKFGQQRLTHIFNASYRNGWARVGGVSHLRTAGAANAMTGGHSANPRDEPGGGIRQGLGGASSAAQFATELPPDRPIQTRQYAFPEIVEPPFHYRNPVSGRLPPELIP